MVFDLCVYYILISLLPCPSILIQDYTLCFLRKLKIIHNVMSKLNLKNTSIFRFHILNSPSNSIYCFHILNSPSNFGDAKCELAIASLMIFDNDFTLMPRARIHNVSDNGVNLKFKSFSLVNLLQGHTNKLIAAEI